MIKRDTLRQELAIRRRCWWPRTGTRSLGGAGSKTKLQEAQEQLRMLLLKDTDQHPDVIAQQKLIEALKPSRDSASGAGKSAGTPAADGAGRRPGKRSVPNPVYDQLKVKLIEADTAVASLQRQRAAAPTAGPAGKDAARAAGPVRRVPEHGPRLQRAAQEL